SGDVTGFTFCEYTSRRFNVRRWNLQHFRSRVHDEPDQLAIELHDQDAVFLVRRDIDVAETLPQIHHRNDLAAQIYNAFHGFRRAGHRRDLWHANNLAYRTAPYAK